MERKEEEKWDKGGEETRNGKEAKVVRADEGQENESPQTELAARKSFSTQDCQQGDARKEPATPTETLDHAPELRGAKRYDQIAITFMLNKLHRTSASVNATTEEKAHPEEQGRRAETEREVATGCHDPLKFSQIARATEGEGNKTRQQKKGPRTQEENARVILFKSLDSNPKCKKAISGAPWSLRRTPDWMQATPDERIRMNKKVAERTLQKWLVTKKGESTQDTESGSSSRHENASEHPEGKDSIEAPRNTSAAMIRLEAECPTSRRHKRPKAAAGFLRDAKAIFVVTEGSYLSTPIPKRLHKGPKAVTGIIWDYSQPAETWSSPAGYVAVNTSSNKGIQRPVMDTSGSCLVEGWTDYSTYLGDKV